jgi:Uma2 family endonuclease
MKASVAASAVDWTVDPEDPRAPPTEIWNQLTPEQRAIVVESLPSDFPPSEASPPEGDLHLDAFTGPREALRRWYRERGRRIYIAGNLPIYYPGERMFSPDLIAVDGAEQRPRDSWIVDAEGGKGLDVAIEIVVRGDRKKDLRRNVERYARLGIPEYYLFDRRNMTLAAWELEGGSYRRRIAQGGRFASAVLGLDLWLDGERLRFSVGEAPVPFVDELIDRVTRLSAEAQERVERLEAALADEQRLREEEQKRREEEQKRREEEQKRREEEQKRREEEQKRREEAEAEVARLRAEIERLRGR